MFGTDTSQLTKVTGVTHRYQLPPRGKGATLAAADMDSSLVNKETRTARAVHARAAGD